MGTLLPKSAVAVLGRFAVVRIPDRHQHRDGQLRACSAASIVRPTKIAAETDVASGVYASPVTSATSAFTMVTPGGIGPFRVPVTAVCAFCSVSNTTSDVPRS